GGRPEGDSPRTSCAITVDGGTETPSRKETPDEIRKGRVPAPPGRGGPADQAGGPHRLEDVGGEGRREGRRVARVRQPAGRQGPQPRDHQDGGGAPGHRDHAGRGPRGGGDT